MTRALGFLVWLALRLYVWIARKPHTTFLDPETGAPYLTRWWLGERNAWPDAEGRTGGPGWYLHKFHRSDWARQLHNHPALYGVAFVLRGGYVETRRDLGAEVTRVNRPPGSVNVITADTFHRVQLRDERRGSWSLFHMGPRSGRGWGFERDDGVVERAAHHDGRTGEVVPR
jgi:hypothetical protein